MTIRSGRSFSAAATASSPVDGLDHLEARAGQQVAQDAPVLLVVLDGEDALAHASLRACRSTRIGTVKRNVDPSPRADSTQRRPPCSSTMRREIARARARCRPSSACWSCRPAGTPRRSSAGRLGRCPGRYPRPTRRRRRRVARASDRRRCPASVNLIALPARFSSTWVSRRSSPRPGGRSAGRSSRGRASSRRRATPPRRPRPWTTSSMA